MTPPSEVSPRQPKEFDDRALTGLSLSIAFALLINELLADLQC